MLSSVAAPQATNATGCHPGGKQEGSESHFGNSIQKTTDNADNEDAPDGPLRSKDPVNLSQETLARLQGAVAARASSADVGVGPTEMGSPLGIASRSNTAAGKIADDAKHSGVGSAAVASKLIDLNGSSHSRPQPIVAVAPAEPASTLDPGHSLGRSRMTAPQHMTPSDGNPQTTVAHAWYSALLAAGHNPDALTSVLSLLNADASRLPHASGHVPLPASASTVLPVHPYPAEAAAHVTAAPLSATLKHLLQAGTVKQEKPAPPAPHKQLLAQSQQVTTGAKSGGALLHNLSDTAAAAWPQASDAAPSTSQPQQGTAKSGSEVLKRTFEARPESPPSKRVRFQGGIAELQQVLSQRAQESSAAVPMPHETLAVEAEARSRRPRSQDLQAKDLTDAVRRESGSRSRTDGNLLKHLIGSIPADSGRAAATAAPVLSWPPQPLDRSRSGLGRMPQPAPAAAHVTAAPPLRPSAYQLLQHNLVAEITGQAPRRLLDQLDPATLGLILTNAGAPATTAQQTVPPPVVSLPAPPTPPPPEPLPSQDLQLMPRPAVPDHARRAPPSRAPAAEAPLSPHAAEQLYMRMEQALGRQGAATLFASYGHKPPSTAPPPAQPPPPNPQSQLLSVLQSLVQPSAALSPVHARRESSDPIVVDPLREVPASADPFSLAAGLTRRPSVNAAPLSPGPTSRSQAGPPISFPAAQPSRRKQSPMLSLAGDRSTGLRASRAADPAGLAHFGAPGGAPQLLTSSDLAKPVAPQLTLGAVDLRSGPAASLATSLPQHLLASAVPPSRDALVAAGDPTAASIIEALTGGSMSPQARQRTLAAIGHFIAEQGQSEPDGDVAAAAADAAAKAATPPPPQAPEPSKEIASNPARSNLAKPPSATPAAAAKAGLSLTEDELQAAELLMALSATPAAGGAAVDPAPAAVQPSLSPAAPTASMPEAPGLADQAPPVPPQPLAAPTKPAAASEGLGSSLAQVLLQQMLTSLGMAAPPLPLQSQASPPGGADGGGGTLTLPHSGPTPRQALATAAGPRLPATSEGEAAQPPGSVAEAVAADLRQAYKVDSWRVDNRRRGPQER